MAGKAPKRLMNGRLALGTGVLCLLAFAPLAGMAQQISDIRVQPANASVGEPVRITVYLETGDAPAGCGLRVTLGDGSSRQMRADLTNMPVTISYTYPSGGQFTIRAVGDTYVRGLRTALACHGDKSAAIRVVDVEAERRRQEAERQAQLAREREQREAADREALRAQQRAEREAAEREAAERKQQLEAQQRLQREREAEVRRLDAQLERELAERAETLRRKERETAAREKALQAREKAARRSARSSGHAPSKQASSGTPPGQASSGNQASSGSSAKPSQEPAKPSGGASRGTLDAF